MNFIFKSTLTKVIGVWIIITHLLWSGILFVFYNYFYNNFPLSEAMSDVVDAFFSLLLGRATENEVLGVIFGLVVFRSLIFLPLGFLVYANVRKSYYLAIFFLGLYLLGDLVLGGIYILPLAVALISDLLAPGQQMFIIQKEGIIFIGFAFLFWILDLLIYLVPLILFIFVFRKSEKTLKMKSIGNIKN